MNLLLYAGISGDTSIPDFGPEHRAHVEAKHHPQVRAASAAAWRLLETALRHAGIHENPTVSFEEGGRPFFKNSPLRFSLSHSKEIAAALLSDKDCGLDVEAILPGRAERLADRCLSPRERAAGMDFFECWTRKECMGKLSGRGLPAHPCEMDSTDPALPGRFHFFKIHDAGGQAYALTALCISSEEIHIQRMSAS